MALLEPCLFGRTPDSSANGLDQWVQLTKSRLMLFLPVPVLSYGLALYLPLILGDTPWVLIINPTSCSFFFFFYLAKLNSDLGSVTCNQKSHSSSTHKGVTSPFSLKVLNGHWNFQTRCVFLCRFLPYSQWLSHVVTVPSIMARTL